MDERSRPSTGAEELSLLIVSLIWVFLATGMAAIAFLLFLPLRLAVAVYKVPTLRLSAILLLGLATVALGSAILLNLPVADFQPQEIIVKKGMTTGDIGRLLEERGLIRSPLLFSIIAKLRRAEHELKAGRYRFERPSTMVSILEKLCSGGIVTKRVTIPEGLRQEEIAGLLARSVGLDSVRFVSLAEDSTFCKELGIPATRLEGYLFPDTYEFYWDIEETEAIRLMVARFHQVFADSLVRRAEEIGFSIHQTVTLASIIEAEAQVPYERPIISSVFHRRLKLGRALEADPTVKYALKKPKRRLLRRDLTIDSPYNTYLHPGLPPGPICNPGGAAILAALYPADTNYLYFVAKGDGTHIFSSSYMQHVNAKNRLKRIRMR